jgi:hypothetical protein
MVWNYNWWYFQLKEVWSKGSQQHQRYLAVSPSHGIIPGRSDSICSQWPNWIPLIWEKALYLWVGIENIGLYIEANNIWEVCTWCTGVWQHRAAIFLTKTCKNWYKRSSAFLSLRQRRISAFITWPFGLFVLSWRDTLCLIPTQYQECSGMASVGLTKYRG